MKNRIRKTATVALAAVLVINPLLPNIKGVNNIVMAAENVDQQVARIADEARILVRKAAPELTMDQIEGYLEEVNKLRSELNSIDTWDTAANVVNAALAQDIYDALAIVQDAEQILIDKKAALTKPEEKIDDIRVQRDINSLKALSEKLDNIKSNNFENTTLEPLMRLFSEYKTIDEDFNKYSYNKHDNSDTLLLTEYQSAHVTTESDLAWAAYTLINKTENYVDNGVNKSDVAEAIKSDTELDLIQKYKTLINAPFTFDQTPDMQSTYNTWMGVIDKLNLSIDELEKSIEEKSSSKYLDNEKVQRDINAIDTLIVHTDESLPSKPTKVTAEYLTELFDGYRQLIDVAINYSYSKHDNADTNLLDEYRAAVGKLNSYTDSIAVRLIQTMDVDQYNMIQETKDAIANDQEKDLLNSYRFLLDNWPSISSIEDPAFINSAVELRSILISMIDQLETSIADKEAAKVYSEKLDKLEKNLQGLTENIDNKGTLERYRSNLTYLQKELNNLGEGPTKELESKRKDLQQTVLTKLNGLDKIEDDINRKEAEAKDKAEKENNKRQVEESINNLTGSNEDKKSKAEDLLNSLDNMNLSPEDKAKLKQDLENIIKDLDKEIKDVNDNKVLDKIKQDLDQVENKPGSSREDLQASLDKLNKTAEELEKVNPSDPKVKIELEKQIKDLKDKLEKQIAKIEAEENDILDKKSNNNKMNEALDKILKDKKTPQETKDALEKLLKDVEKENLSERDKSALRKTIQDHIDATEKIIKSLEAQKEIEQDIRRITEAPITHNAKKSELEKLLKELPNFDLDEVQRNKLEREIRQLIEEFVIKENNDRVAEFEKRLEELESRQYSSSTSINFDKIEDLRKAIDELPENHPMRQKLIDKLAKIEGEVKKVENIQKEIEEAKKIENPEERRAKLEELQRRILLLPPSEDRDALLAQLGLDTQTIAEINTPAEINNPQMGDAGTMLSSGLIGLSALGLRLIGKKKKED